MPDAIEVQPPHARRTRLVDANPDIRLHKQEIESGLQILAYRAGRRRSVHCPPLNNAFHLASRASRDEKFERHS
jgi:hypothetical protein